MGLAFVLMSSVAFVVGAEDAQKDLDKMQGTWTVVAAERNGRKSPEEALKTMQVVIKGNVLTVVEGKDRPQPRQENATLTLTPSKKPKTLDIKPVGGKEENTARGIYELKDGVLRMCWTNEGGERPEEFSTKPDSNSAMFVLTRENNE